MGALHIFFFIVPNNLLKNGLSPDELKEMVLKIILSKEHGSEENTHTNYTMIFNKWYTTCVKHLKAKEKAQMAFKKV